MPTEPLYFVWDYRDVDRDFWREHLEDWVPHRIVDAHSHVAHEKFRLEKLSDEKRRQYWVNELDEKMDAPTAERCDRITYPGREVIRIALGTPSLDFDVDGNNEYLREECLKREWHALSVLRPEWSAERVEEELAKPGVLGLKPYYTLIGNDPISRDRYIEASIFDFLPHHALEVVNARCAWIALHVPRAGRLPDPQNIREIKEIRKRYPKISLVIAHLGRCYTEPHAAEAFPQLADDPGLYFDNCAVLNPDVHRLAFETFGPERILYGTDNPIFYMRGRRQWHGTSYVNRTSYPFHFNKDRESPEVEAGYTLYMYEALRAIRQAAEDVGLSRSQIESVFNGNADRLINKVLDAKDE